ncbi:hypothetical protein BDY17DRAFT_325855 [Neohortaea acidophila]|uniref:BTB domain-containing protein n=1 Tax=Neohortaea acidophila TaxID=245834 RepID=A0A6A6PM12_9PEZI|nr:uncharacterized protein BDY17DRAFT_325855 [Neohortaea acidophila]KAF2481138.1 hypothetical protein BDY17DRAFT_325855 [Neohortaea acidophila]
MASQGFPQFSDGDVEISLGGRHDAKLVLHSYVLALHSSWFKASLSDRWNHENDLRLVGEKQRWFYVLQFDKGTDFAMLARKPDSESIAIPSGEVLEVEAVREQDARQTLRVCDQYEMVEAHQDLFCALYHAPLSFEDWPISAAHSRHVNLARLGKMYRCEAVVSLHIARLLGRCQDDILTACIREPDEQLSLAYEAKSAWIFKEAATNLVGRSDASYKTLRKGVQEAQVGELLDRKRADFVAALKACEHKMFCILPRQNGGPMSYTAVSFFRFWLSEKISNDGRGSGLQPGYANLYHTIRLNKVTLSTLTKEKVGQKYVDGILGVLEEQDVTELEIQLSLVVSEAAKILQSILNDTRRRNKGKKDEFRALTFIEIADEELPWSTP